MIGVSISPAYAGPPAPTCSLHIAGGVDVGSFMCDFVGGDKFEIFETWTGTDDTYIIFNNLVIGVNYEVEKKITNSIETPGVGTNIQRIIVFSNEVLDPSGNFNDVQFDGPCPGTICPAGFSRSNDPDKLSFAQNADPPTRDSDIFFSLTPDEFGQIDFLDWMGTGTDADGFHPGQICNSSTDDDAGNGFGNPVCTDPIFDTQNFGLRDDDTFGQNQPFLLREALTPTAPPMIGGEMVSSDFAVLAIAEMKDNAFNLLGILSLAGVATFAALYFSVKRK